MDGEVTIDPVKPYSTARSDLTAVLALAVVGFGLRLVVTRSIWLDEAISIAQAQLPFNEMLASLRQDGEPSRRPQRALGRDRLRAGGAVAAAALLRRVRAP